MKKNLNKPICRQRADILLDELTFCELDGIAKVVATQIPTKMFLRIVNKFRRLRGADPITYEEIMKKEFG